MVQQVKSYPAYPVIPSKKGKTKIGVSGEQASLLAERARLLAEGEALLSSARKETPRLDAEVLLASAMGVERAEMLLDFSDVVDLRAKADYRGYIERRAKGEPVAYITGMKDFYKHSFSVNRSALIPRPETEELVEAVLRKFGPDAGKLSVLDVGTGSGCIAISLALERPSWEILATDLSPEALSVATKNAHRLRARNVKFAESDFFCNVRGKFDVIVSNPPYIDETQKDTLQIEVREYEPYGALFTEDGGTKFTKELLAKAPDYLKTGGTLFCETGFGQKEAIEKFLEENGWKNINFLRDLAGHWRSFAATPL